MKKAVFSLDASSILFDCQHPTSKSAMMQRLSSPIIHSAALLNGVIGKANDLVTAFIALHDTQSQNTNSDHQMCAWSGE
jgi:hypothetical protein